VLKLLNGLFDGVHLIGTEHAVADVAGHSERLERDGQSIRSHRTNGSFPTVSFFGSTRSTTLRCQRRAELQQFAINGGPPARQRADDQCQRPISAVETSVSKMPPQRRQRDQHGSFTRAKASRSNNDFTNNGTIESINFGTRWFRPRQASRQRHVSLTAVVDQRLIAHWTNTAPTIPGSSGSSRHRDARRRRTAVQPGAIN